MLQICFLFVAFDLEDFRFELNFKNLISSLYLSLYSDLFPMFFLLFHMFFVFIFYQNVTDINISSTPQLGSHGHKKLQIVTRKATVR